MKLASYIRKKKLTLAAFAEMVDVYPQTIHRYIHNLQYPRPHIAQKIVSATGGMVTMADLYQPMGGRNA